MRNFHNGSADVWIQNLLNMLTGKAGVDQTAMRKWELEKSYPDVESDKKLAALFNTPIDIILGREKRRIFKKIGMTRRLKLIIDDAVLSKRKNWRPRQQADWIGYSTEEFFWVYLKNQFFK